MRRAKLHDPRRLVLVVAGLTIVLIAVWVAAGQFRDSIPEPQDLAAQMSARLAQLETVQGQLQLVNGVAVAEQELWVERPRRLRTEIESGPPGLAPIDTNQKTTLVLNEEEAWFYNPNLSIATVTDRTDYAPEAGLDVGGSILESMPEDILAALGEAIDIQILGEEEVANRRALRVQILLAEADNSFGGRILNVALDQEFYYPLAVESDGGFVLKFHSIHFNDPIDPATFSFVPPAGISVNEIRN
jgi:outer membrane lipoprotein-sorting protein